MTQIKPFPLLSVGKATSAEHGDIIFVSHQLWGKHKMKVNPAYDEIKSSKQLKEKIYILLNKRHEKFSIKKFPII